jgi:hypothetical protein
VIARVLNTQEKNGLASSIYENQVIMDENFVRGKL